MTCSVSTSYIEGEIALAEYQMGNVLCGRYRSEINCRNCASVAVIDGCPYEILVEVSLRYLYGDLGSVLSAVVIGIVYTAVYLNIDNRLRKVHGEFLGDLLIGMIARIVACVCGDIYTVIVSVKSECLSYLGYEVAVSCGNYPAVGTPETKC